MHALVVITGASRGYGRAMGVEFARCASAADDVTFLLLSRDAAGLADTAHAIRAAHPSAAVLTSFMDVSDLSALDSAWGVSQEKVATARTGRPAFDVAYLVNNAGTVGEVHTIGELQSLPDLIAAINTNVTSTIWITTLFTRFLKGPGGLTGGSVGSTVINISSLAAVVPFATMGVYSIAKAARDMLHSVVAAEEGSVRTLNWAPGPMNTSMQHTLRASDTLHAPSREFFHKLAAEDKYVPVDESAAKCWRIVRAAHFTSGAHIDFYDAEPTAPSTASSGAQ